VWSDSKGRLWISEWNSGNVSVYDPAAKTWKQWLLPGEKPRTDLVQRLAGYSQITRYVRLWRSRWHQLRRD